MENDRQYTKEELFNPDVDVMDGNMTRPRWMYPDERWSVFHPIMAKSNTYSEFKMKCEIMGYTGYFTNSDKNKDLKIYDIFILSGVRYFSKKFLRFRDQLLSSKNKHVHKKIN